MRCTHTHTLQNNAAVCPSLCPAAALEEMRIKIQNKMHFGIHIHIFIFISHSPPRHENPGPDLISAPFVTNTPIPTLFPMGNLCWVFCWVTNGIFLIYSLEKRQLLGDPKNPKSGDGFQGMISQISLQELLGKKVRTGRRSDLWQETLRTRCCFLFFSSVHVVFL